MAIDEALGRLFNEASGGKARLISGQDLIDLLSGKPGALKNVLGDVKDCGNADCPIHGYDEDNSLTAEDLEVMEPEEMEMLALSATGAASNALMGKEFGLTVLLQKQAELWRSAAEEKRNRRAGEKLAERRREEQAKVDNTEVRADETEPVL